MEKIIRNILFGLLLVVATATESFGYDVGDIFNVKVNGNVIKVRVTNSQGTPRLVSARSFVEFNNSAVKIPETFILNGITYRIATYESSFLSSIAQSATTLDYESKVSTSGLFKNCKKLKTAAIDRVTSLGSNTFKGSTALKSVTLTGKMTSIGSEAFKGCTSLTSLSLYSGINSVGNGAFSSTNLSTVPFSHLKVLGKHAFEFCNSLKEADLSECTISTVADYTFNGCQNLSSVHLPASVTSLGNYALAQTGLTEFTVGDKVTAVGDGCFSANSQLQEVVLPSGLTKVGKEVFRDCKKLQRIVSYGTPGSDWDAMAFANAIPDGKIPELVISRTNRNAYHDYLPYFAQVTYFPEIVATVPAQNSYFHNEKSVRITYDQPTQLNYDKVYISNAGFEKTQVSASKVTRVDDITYDIDISEVYDALVDGSVTLWVEDADHGITTQVQLNYANSLTCNNSELSTNGGSLTFNYPVQLTGMESCPLGIYSATDDSEVGTFTPTVKGNELQLVFNENLRQEGDYYVKLAGHLSCDFMTWQEEKLTFHVVNVDKEAIATLCTELQKKIKEAEKQLSLYDIDTDYDDQLNDVIERTKKLISYEYVFLSELQDAESQLDTMLDKFLVDVHMFYTDDMLGALLYYPSVFEDTPTEGVAMYNNLQSLLTKGRTLYQSPDNDYTGINDCLADIRTAYKAYLSAVCHSTADWQNQLQDRLMQCGMWSGELMTTGDETLASELEQIPFQYETLLTVPGGGGSDDPFSGSGAGSDDDMLIEKVKDAVEKVCLKLETCTMPLVHFYRDKIATLSADYQPTINEGVMPDDTAEASEALVSLQEAVAIARTNAADPFSTFQLLSQNVYDMDMAYEHFVSTSTGGVCRRLTDCIQIARNYLESYPLEEYSLKKLRYAASEGEFALVSDTLTEEERYVVLNNLEAAIVVYEEECSILLRNEIERAENVVSPSATLTQLIADAKRADEENLGLCTKYTFYAKLKENTPELIVSDLATILDFIMEKQELQSIDIDGDGETSLIDLIKTIDILNKNK